MAQASKTKQTSPKKTEEVEVEETPIVSSQNTQLADDVDDILDEIDEVLEENAEQFVKSYVQKGGQ